MIKIFQLSLELVFGFVVMTCAIPVDDSGKSMAIEPVRFVCTAEVNNSGAHIIAGQIFKIGEREADNIAGEWQ